MSKIHFSFLFSLLLLGACSSNNSPTKKSTGDSTETTNDASSGHLNTIVSIKDMIIGTWAGKKMNEPDTLEISKEYIHDKGEDTRLMYHMKGGDSIIIFGDSTTILTKPDIVYRAKVLISNDSLKFIDSKDITTLVKIK